MYKFFVTVSVISCLIFIFPILKGQNETDTLRSAEKRTPKMLIEGEIRARVRNYNRINFGDVALSANDYDTYLNLRGIVSADVRLNKTFRLYTQLYTASTFGKDDLSSTDKDFLDFGQAFLDIDLNFIPVTFRLGRQVLTYGSGKILGTSENPNSIRSFEGITTILNMGALKGELLFASPVSNKLNLFDNKINTSSLIYASYWNLGLKNSRFLDFYFFGNHLKDIFIDDITANENRYSLGSRFGRDDDSFFYDTEATWQFGNHGIKNISAFYLSSTVGYSWDNSHLKPSFQIRGAMYTGDKDSTDQQLNIFRPVYARPPVSSMAPIGPTNIVMFAPEANISITEEIGINIRYYAIWRLTKNDGLYSSRMDRMTREPDKNGDTKGSFVTSGLSARIDYDITKHLNINFSTGFFFAGEYLNNTGKGKNVQANFIVANYSF
jgi:hypothetical protein